MRTSAPHITPYQSRSGELWGFAWLPDQEQQLLAIIRRYVDSPQYGLNPDDEYDLTRLIREQRYAEAGA